MTEQLGINFASMGTELMTDRFKIAWRLQMTEIGDAGDITAPEVLRHYYDEAGVSPQRVVCISANALDEVLDEINIDFGV